MLDQLDIVLDVVAFIEIDQKPCRSFDRRKKIAIRIVEDARDAKYHCFGTSRARAPKRRHITSETLVNDIGGMIRLRRLVAEREQPVAHALSIRISDQRDII